MCLPGKIAKLYIFTSNYSIVTTINKCIGTLDTNSRTAVRTALIDRFGDAMDLRLLLPVSPIFFSFPCCFWGKFGQMIGLASRT